MTGISINMKAQVSMAAAGTGRHEHVANHNGLSNDKSTPSLVGVWISLILSPVRSTEYQVFIFYYLLFIFYFFFNFW